MNAIGGNRLVAREHVHVLFEHDVGTAVPLFARLEPNDNVALELVFMRGNQVSRTDADGHVQVVAAGVHVSVGRGVLESGVFFYGEGIHVGAKQHGRAWLRTPNQ